MSTEVLPEKRTVTYASALSALVAAAWIVSAEAACNTAPTAVDDETSTYDQAILIDVLANDSDPDGQGLTVALLSESCPGSVSVDFELLTLTPSAPLSSDCTISYSVTDEGGLSATAAVQVRAASAPAEIFSDDFESGGVSAWSETVIEPGSVTIPTPETLERRTR